MFMILCLILAEVSLSRTSNSPCSSEHQIRVLASVIEVQCKSRPTLVEIPNPDASSVIRTIPGHVIVNRCSGSCDSPSHDCLPATIENTTIDVMAVQTTFDSGRWNTLCTRVVVEKHTSCRCSCLLTPDNCSSNHVYQPERCRCGCRDRQARSSCISAGKLWNEDTCTCVCPQPTWRPCSTGYSFDYINTCSCVRTYDIASGGLAGFLVVAGFLLLSGIGFLAAVRKTKRINDERRSGVRRQLNEAFRCDSEMG